MDKGEKMDAVTCYSANEESAGVKPKRSAYSDLLKNKDKDGIYVFCSKDSPNPKWEKAYISLN